jgi:hypothetical protein
MGLLDRLFRRSGAPTEAVDDAAGTECPHTTLTARWDSAEDMGNEDKATSFICTACNESFAPEEAMKLRATEAERLRQNLT